MKAVIILTLLFCSISCVSGKYVITENSNLLASDVKWLAYENSWQIHFSNVDLVDFDVLVFEICTGKGEVCRPVLPPSTLMNCEKLKEHFNTSSFKNEFVKTKIHEENFCFLVHSKQIEFQIGLNVIWRDSSHTPVLFVRQPLSLIIFNDASFMNLFDKVNLTGNAGKLHFELFLKITQILTLQEMFAVHQSIIQIHVQEPDMSYISFSVQNPCTAIGFSAPEFGAVSLHLRAGREICMWTCRVDKLRIPFNSIPATVQQVNKSSVAYLQLPIKYACYSLPKQWVAFFFAFELDTRMIVTNNEIAQELHDALDTFAQSLTMQLSKSQFNLQDVQVLLAVRDSMYYLQNFETILSSSAEASCLLTHCENSWYPPINSKYPGWVNNNYVYLRRKSTWLQRSARKLLRTMNLKQLLVEGVVITSQTQILSNEQFRLSSMNNIRSVLSRNEYFFDNYTALQVSRVQDLDIKRVVGYINVQKIVYNNEKNETGTNTVIVYDISYLFVFILIIICVVVFIFLLIMCVLYCKERLENDQRETNAI